ncbi:MAG: hypothetical protein IJX05_02370, partial [Clostridia bacterium]|nr:hypothetical protein [Clostridia bacterium]
MFAKDFRKAAWKKLKYNWGNAIGALFLYILLSGGLSITINFREGVNQVLFIIVSVIVILVSLV